MNKADSIITFNYKQFVAGLFFLLFGSSFYIFFRTLDSTFFLQDFAQYQAAIPEMSAYAVVVASAPDYFHPLALSLLTMAVLKNRLSRVFVCLAWLCIEIMFEFSQLYSAQLTDLIPVQVMQMSVTGLFVNYMSNGTFDSLDVVAIVAGCITAFLLGEGLARNYKLNSK